MVSNEPSERKPGGRPASITQTPASNTAFTLAHFSDPHMACPDDIRLRELLNKRLYGYLKWKLHRGAEHSENILAALQHDLKQTLPDHIAVTGDLTHLSLPAEFQKAEHWLRSLGTSGHVTVIPGNHDAYVRTKWNQTFAHWAPYMISDNSRFHESAASSFQDIFPSLRVRGRIALIGLSTAHPSAPYLAVGRIGSPQLQKLKSILVRTAEQRLFRILLIHHPPARGIVSWRKRLTDAADLRSLLARYGVELVLHGHAHQIARSLLKTPSGNVPVIGAPSVSSLGRSAARRSRYYAYRIKPVRGGWEVKLSARIYAPEEDRFVLEHEYQMNCSR